MPKRRKKKVKKKTISRTVKKAAKKPAKKPSRKTTKKTSKKALKSGAKRVKPLRGSKAPKIISRKEASGRIVASGDKIYSDINDWATPDFIHSMFIKQEDMIRDWEINLKHYGILVTHLNPYNDPRLENINYSAYRIHLDKGLWVTSHQETPINFLGAKLYSNAGRGSGPRGKMLEVD